MFADDPKKLHGDLVPYTHDKEGVDYIAFTNSPYVKSDFWDVRLVDDKDMEKDEREKDFLKFQLRRKITNLYKRFLIILEDVCEDQYNNNEEAYQKARKKILDEGNDTIRELEENMDQFDIRLK